MEKRSRLGRGLSSLLNTGEVDEPIVTSPVSPISATPVFREIAPVPQDENAGSNTAAGQVFHVELSSVIANPNQPRRTFDQSSLSSLADSIKVAGVIQPVIVRQVDGRYELIAGERRWRAAKLAQLQTIPVIIRDLDNLERSQIALIENIHREDLNPMERALAYQEILRSTGLTQVDLAAKLGEDRSTIANHMRLIELPDSVRQMLANASLSFGHAKLLAGLADATEQHRLAAAAVAGQWSVRELERQIKTAKPVAPPTPAAKAATPHIADLERRISRDLQMRAEVKQAVRGGKGKLVLHYGSLDQFDELLSRLGIKVDD